MSDATLPSICPPASDVHAGTTSDSSSGEEASETSLDVAEKEDKGEDSAEQGNRADVKQKRKRTR